MARKPDVDNTETINILSLCTGYGGLELGLSLALEGVFRVVAVEVEAYALANLAAKAQESKLAIEAMWPDCKTFPAERFRGCFDFILAGFPCQPFSVAGKRQGGADDRHLWPHIARIIKTIKPVWVFLENVPGLLSARTLDNRPDLCRYLANLATLAKIAPTAKKRWYLSEHIKRLTGYLLRTEGVPAYASVYFSLRNMGYSVEAGLFTAAECGAPHKRERLFVLAYNETSGFSGSNISIRQSQRQKQTETDSMWISEMENTQRLGRRRGDNGEPAGQGRSLQTQRPSELADTQRTRQSCSIYRQRQVQSWRTGTRWPARPGQPQYEWEEPRIVADASRYTESLPRIRSLGKTQTERQAQSGVGGAIDGTKYRVDRLRLLGNGVVPQCAELAFRNLIRKFE